mgnify:CR=1 FL=1
METAIISNEDLQYLASRSSDNLNMILAGMTSLMEENNDNIHMLENQNWFQRMSRTISGKNRMVQQDIAHNHDKINLYVTEALGELYSRNCIDHEIILGLGNKVNELYEKQVEIKQIIGAFAQKLNQKIESIDNYHMLIEEINQGIYSSQGQFVSISKIMSQLDLRTVKDNRKMEILIRAMREQKIIENKEISFCFFLEETLKLSEAEAGVLALFFGNIRDEYVAEIAEKIIYTYYTMPEKIRKMKSKRSVVESVLKDNDIDLEYSISSQEMCETLIQAYIDNVFEVAIEEQRNVEDKKREYIKDYIDSSMKLLVLLKDMVETWDANNGELNTYKSRKEYAEFMESLIDNLNKNSYIRNSIITNLNNMTFLIQNIFSKHNELKINESDISRKVNRNVAIELPDVSGTKYQTVTEYFLEFIKNMFDDPTQGRTKQMYSLQTLETLAEDFPDPSSYQYFSYSFMYMENYVALYNTFFNNLIEKLEDNSFLEEVFSLCKRFPVEYNSDYDDVLVRYIDLASMPHIELEYMFNEFLKRKYVGYALLGGLGSYKTTTVIVRLFNVNLENYTVHFDVIENQSGVDVGRYANIEWGDWIEANAIELKITNISGARFGTLKIKVCVLENPEIVAYIQ